MKINMKSVLEDIEKTMACVAYAEAGEPCPLDEELKEIEKLDRCKMSMQGTMTCIAYAEAGVSCPICEGA